MTRVPQINRNSKLMCDTSCGLVGFVFGAWLVGFRNLDPRSINWLSDDARIAQLAYEFYWRDSWYRLPLDSTARFGFGWGVGLNQNAQNSLTGLVLRPLARLFESGFQFQGLWLAICFGLQMIFARRLLLHFRLPNVAALIGAVVVTLCPALISRIGSMWHPQLAAHWLILLALLLYFQKVSIGRWLVVSVLALTVTVYMAVIVLVVALTSLMVSSSWNSHKLQLKSVARCLFGSLSLVSALAAAGWLMGLVNISTNATVTGVGFYRLNVLAFVNPADEKYGFITNHLDFFESREWISEGREGFAYMGLGVLITMPILVVWLARSLRASRSRLIPILIVAIALFLVALSERIALGGREFVVAIPEEVARIRQIFRAAPRFSWLLLYLLMVLGWSALTHVVYRFNSPRVALGLLLTVATIQIVDVSPGVIDARASIRASKGEFAPDLSSRWKSLLRTYNQISIVPSIDANEDDVELTGDERKWIEEPKIFQLAWVAAMNNASTNFSYCARPCLTSARRSTREARREINSGDPARGIIYVFSNETEWRKSAAKLKAKPERIDGLMVVLTRPLSATDQ